MMITRCVLIVILYLFSTRHGTNAHREDIPFNFIMDKTLELFCDSQSIEGLTSLSKSICLVERTISTFLRNLVQILMVELSFCRPRSLPAKNSGFAFNFAFTRRSTRPKNY